MANTNINVRERIDNELLSAEYVLDQGNPIGVQYTFGAPISQTIDMFGEAIGCKHVYDGTPAGREGMSINDAIQWIGHLDAQEAENVQLEGILIEMTEDPLAGLSSKKSPKAPVHAWELVMNLQPFELVNSLGFVTFGQSSDYDMSGFPLITLTCGFQFVIWSDYYDSPNSESTIYGFAKLNGHFKPAGHGGMGVERLGDNHTYPDEAIIYGAANHGDTNAVNAVQYSPVNIGVCREVDGIGSEIRFSAPIKACDRRIDFTSVDVPQERLDYISENFRLILKLRGAGKKVGAGAFNSKCVVVYKNVEYGWDSDKLLINNGHIQINHIDFDCSTEDGAISAAIELQKMARKSNNEQAYWIKGSI